MLSILVFFILYDAIFFWINQSFLNQTIKKVQHSPVKVQLVGAGICYVALTILMYLTLSWNYAKTFLFGASIYAVYEGTNYAIFKEWPLSMVLLDTLWGGILFVLVKLSYRSLSALF
jgi:uncharacterized membrane protein